MIRQQTPSMEDYLEAIIMLREGDRVVRVSEISKILGVKKPSVTSALRKLSEQALVEHERYSYVELTAEGERIAEDVFHRHQILCRFLAEILDIDPKIAGADACKMEHFVSPVTLERLAKFVEFMLTCPQGEPECLKAFNYYCEHGERGKEFLARCQGSNA